MGSTTYTTAQRAAFRVVVADQTTNPNSVDELKLTDTASVTWDTTTPPAVKATVPSAGITYAMLQNGIARSVVGVPGNAAGVHSDIQAVGAGSVLRESGGTIGFGTVSGQGIAANAVDNTKLAQMANNTVKGRVTAGTGNPEDLTQAQLQALADVWTEAVLASDFTTSSASVVDVTGLAFTPSANTTYEFTAILMCRTATATVNPRIGLAWPTGMTDGVASIDQSQTTAGGYIYAVGNISAALLTGVGGLPDTTGSWPVYITGIAKAGATPSGTVKIQLASETAGTTVTIKTGSFIKWRVV